MKKKFFCIILTVLFIFSFLYKPISVNATGIEALPYIITTGWDSTVAAYGALKGFQYGSTSSTPEIVGDYTKPYTYSNESIAPLKPSWDSYADNFFANNWSDLYPVYSEADAQKAWELEKKSFDEKIGLGNIDMNSYLYNVLNNWLPTLVGTDYIKSVENPVYSGWNGNNSTFVYKAQVNSGGVWSYPVESCNLDVGVEGYTIIGVTNFLQTASYNGDTAVGSVTYQSLSNPDSYLVKGVFIGNRGGWNPSDKPYDYYAGWNGDFYTQEITSSSWQSQYDVIANCGMVSSTSGSQPVVADKSNVPLYDEKTESEVITQLPVGNPNDNNDKDNKKITVLPNVPSISGNLNNLGNINNGQLPIKFPSPDHNGLIPSIPVVGNGGITVNIPVTNNNYEVINNYDEHQEIYNNNYSYPTINQNYVNYYINEGAITYEQFLQALQKYFNVITYNNETNNYYPTTINNTTNNYYTIQEVIGNEIPPILPPSTISVIDRFPFSIPFDIYKLLCLFNAPAHYWEWDIPVPTFQSGGSSNENYHGEIGHIDFSSTMHISLEQWEPVALVLRTMFSVLWLLFLYFIFQKLVH